MASKVNKGNWNGEFIRDIHMCGEFLEDQRYKDNLVEYAMAVFPTGTILQYRDSEESPETQYFGSARIKFCPFCGVQFPWEDES